MIEGGHFSLNFSLMMHTGPLSTGPSRLSRTAATVSNAPGTFQSTRQIAEDSALHGDCLGGSILTKMCLQKDFEMERREAGGKKHSEGTGHGGF
jgi:hypothetical protein